MDEETRYRLKLENDRLLRLRSEWQQRQQRLRYSEHNGNRGSQKIFRAAQLEPASLDTILKKERRALGITAREKHAELFAAWDQIIPDAFRSFVRIDHIRGGYINVAVSNAALKQELEHFHQDALLSDLRAAACNMTIRGLKFRLDVQNQT